MGPAPPSPASAAATEAAVEPWVTLEAPPEVLPSLWCGCPDVPAAAAWMFAAASITAAVALAAAAADAILRLGRLSSAACDVPAPTEPAPVPRLEPPPANAAGTRLLTAAATAEPPGPVAAAADVPAPRDAAAVDTPASPGTCATAQLASRATACCCSCACAPAAEGLRCPAWGYAGKAALPAVLTARVRCSCASRLPAPAAPPALLWRCFGTAAAAAPACCCSSSCSPSPEDAGTPDSDAREPGPLGVRHGVETTPGCTSAVRACGVTSPLLCWASLPYRCTATDPVGVAEEPALATPGLGAEADLETV
mmetsp:Transcript_15579/g.38781  ORF Transcript_15579/g.38781 Transcript_15579/m.38781 type:complete len:310 (+) Transcript_15579:633-1562(+)